MTTKSPQQKAIEKTEGPCLVMAGAGTGKTYTILKKIAHLIQNNLYNPSNILCLTFSNEATNNLKKKLQEELPTASKVTVRTFHGFCADILKELGHKIKIQTDFELLMPEDAKVWFHRFLGVDPYNSDRYVSTISTAKDLGIHIEQIKEYAETLKSKLGDISDLDEHAKNLEFELNILHLNPSSTVEERRITRERKKEIKEFLDIYDEYKKYNDFLEAWQKYETLKKEKNVLDYADLNFNVIQLFNQFGAEETAQKYSYIFIDEFQDTNKLQFELIEHIAKEHKNLTVVGDPNQSIYGFRGAYRESFNHFKEVFGVNDESDVFTLDKSYRSPNRVLKVSHQLIKNNYENQDECFLVENAENKEGDTIQVIELKNAAEEARKVAEVVEEFISNGTPLNEICILFRTHQQGRLLRTALEAKNIPLVTAGKTNLMQKPEIRTTVAYLSILNNIIERTGTGEQSWWSLFHYNNSLSPEDSVRIGRYLKKRRNDGLSIDEALLTSIGEIELSEAGKKVISRIVSKLKELLNSSNKALPDLVLDIYELAGLNRAFTHARSIRNIEALTNLKIFYELAESYYKNHDQNLSSFIDYLEILDKLGVNIDASKIKDVNAIRFMTMHAAKGLEFDTVIVTNLAENRFPIKRTPKEPLIPKEFNPDIKRYLESLGEINEKDKDKIIKQYEKDVLNFEERRLCYVSFTRAKNNLIITYAKSYNKEDDSASPSMFLNEINFQENENVNLVQDEDEKCTIFAPCSKFEQFKSLLKNQFIEALDADDFDNLLSRLMTYYAVREGEINEDFNKIKDWTSIVDRTELERHIKMGCDKCSCLRFDPSIFTFSPTALLDYKDCPKRYELKHIFQMPERGAFEISGATTGSFVHDLLESGVKNQFKSKAEFVSKAEEMEKLPEWEGIDMADVKSLLDVFWARHVGRYDDKSKVEEWLNIEIEGLRFNGKFDRIDFLSENDVEVIDYKTNKNEITPDKRAWQLGFYAVAIKKQYGYNPIKLTLEMLRLEKPFEADVDKDGNVTSGRAKGFNINEVEKELVECAKSIVKDYEGEFKVAEKDDPCRNCGYKFYCPKWDS